MIDFILSYQATVFCDISNFTAKTENFQKVLDLYKDKGLVPLPFQEITPELKTTNRIQLISENEEWSVSFPSHRIDLEKKLVDLNKINLGTVEEFSQEAIVLFSRFLDMEKIKSSRLAFRYRSVLRESDLEALHSIFTHIINPIQFYSENKPNEWRMRLSSNLPETINDNEEKINVITDIIRNNFSLPRDGELQKFNRVQIHFDINTHQHETANRFEKSELEEFFPKAINLSKTVLSQIEEKLRND